MIQHSLADNVAQKYPSLMDHYSHHLNKFFSDNNHKYDFSHNANIRNLEDKYLLSVLAPGFKKEDIKVALKDHMLIISAKAKHSDDLSHMSGQLKHA